MKRWIINILLGRFLNQPLTSLEDKISQSQPVRQFARLIVRLVTRGRWEIQQIKSSTLNQNLDAQALKAKLKKIEEELKKNLK